METRKQTIYYSYMSEELLVGFALYGTFDQQLQTDKLIALCY